MKEKVVFAIFFAHIHLTSLVLECVRAREWVGVRTAAVPVSSSRPLLDGLKKSCLVLKIYSVSQEKVELTYVHGGR